MTKDSNTDQYKESLNLPTTAFPMKAGLANKEPAMLAKWQADKLYEKIRSTSAGRKQFILHDGPPYANGAIHIGHAVNKIVKDIIIKAKTLAGFDAPLTPGWDCHGLPIELQVEKKVGKAPVKISYSDFRAKCREYAAKQVDIQKQDFIRLGIFADWDNPYITMEPKTEAATVDALAQIIANNHLYQGVKPVHWCLDCSSALAEAEVEYQDKQSHAIDVAFNLVDASKLAGFATSNLPAQVVIPIWTTTPWTLPANQAVAVNEKFTYVILSAKGTAISAKDTAIIVSKDLLASVTERYQLDNPQIIGELTGADLAGLQLQHPFYKRQVPVVLSTHVTSESGTGAVHIAPAHGMDDYAVGLKYKLPVESPVDARGIFAKTDPYIGGQHLSKANGILLEMLEDIGALLAHKKITHSYPHCWRHKSPIIFRATPQWFIGMHNNSLLKSALAQVDTVKWIPSWGKERIELMLTDRPDWCISRQRCWGTPIPLFIHQQTGKLHPRTNEIMQQVSAQIAKVGIDYWFDLDSKELLGDEASEYLKITDTLDVWFDSGVTHTSVLQQGADLYVEGSDQHRGWFQSSLLTAVAIKGQSPYKQVLTHGFVVDEKGHKMSKSLGNVIAPQKIVQKYGADVLRLWVATSDFTKEMTISDQIIKNTSDIYRRIRNTARFLLANLHDFTPDTHSIAPEDMLALDKWIVDQAYHLQQQLVADYDNYNFAKAIGAVHNFCANELGGFYLDVIKDRQYTMAADSPARRSCQTAMYLVVNALVGWIAPVLSFTSEEISQYIPGDRPGSIFLTLWDTNLQPLLVSEKQFNQNFWQAVVSLRDLVNKELEQARNNSVIGSGLEAQLDIYCDETLHAKLELLADELKFLFIVSRVNLHLAAAAGFSVKVSAYSFDKCIRCWHRHESIGSDTTHSELCSRCVTNLSAVGETRLYA
jgi:isoleucyl-tRNA synthetase